MRTTLPILLLSIVATAPGCSSSSSPGAENAATGGNDNGNGGSANGGNGNGGNANGGNANGGSANGGNANGGNANGGSANGGSGAGGSQGQPDGGSTADDSGVAVEGGTAGDGGLPAFAPGCPSGFTPKDGMNTGFLSDGTGRQFFVLLPHDTSTPRPVFVALTGTVQKELDFASQSGLDKLTNDGWVVLVPVRTCSQNNTNCSTNGSDGRIWEPWYDGTSPRTDDAGPDVRFVESMVECAATKWSLDAKRFYVGGISAGGSFTNHNMLFNSALFAGGVDSSGDWYGGGVLPAHPQPMDPSIVIVNWGGPTDQWPAQNPIAVYAPETKSASQYYASQSNVVTVSCTNSQGHIWPTTMTPWIAKTLLSYPKGSTPSSFHLTTPPSGYSCVVGEFTDH